MAAFYAARDGYKLMVEYLVAEGASAEEAKIWKEMFGSEDVEMSTQWLNMQEKFGNGELVSESGESFMDSFWLSSAWVPDWFNKGWKDFERLYTKLIEIGHNF